MNLLKKLFLKNIYASILLVSIVFFMIIALCLPIRFEENDDVMMLLFASGQYTGTPEPFLVFINVIYGYFVSSLYCLTNKIEWYSVLFCLIHIFSFSIVIWGVVTKKTSKILRILFVLLFLSIEIKLILFLQFTTTSAIACLAGIVMLSKEKYYQKSIGVLFLIIGSLIRFEVFALVILVASPLLVYLIRDGKDNPVLCIRNKSLICITFVLLFAILFKFVDTSMYNSFPDWKYYKEYNSVRGKINDNPNVIKAVGKLPKGVTNNDYQLLLDFFQDARVMNLNQLTRINKVIDNVDFTQKLHNVFSLRHYTGFLSLMVFMSVLFSIYSSKNKVYLIVSLLMFILLLSYIALDGSLKYRVFLSALLIFCYSQYFLAELENQNVIFMSFFSISILVFIVLFNSRTNKINKINATYRTDIFVFQTDIINRYFDRYKTSLVPVSGEYKIECLSPFKITETNKFRKMYFGGWLTTIPYNKMQFDNFDDLKNKQAIFISKAYYVFFVDMLQQAYKVHYGVTVKPVVLLANSNYIVFKLN